MTNIHDISDAQARRIVEILMKAHQTVPIHPPCGHNHEDGEEGIVFMPSIGWTCAKPFDYCEECCGRRTGLGSIDGDDVSDYCAEHHLHEAGRPACSIWETILAVTVGEEAKG